MSDDVTLPTPDEVAAMRARHTALPPDPNGVVWCLLPTCSQHWPCDAARLLALVDTLDSTVLDLELANSRIRDRENEGRARLAAVLAECNVLDEAIAFGRKDVRTDSIRRAATGEGS